MGTIEQASKRLEQLGRAGVGVPWSDTANAGAAQQTMQPGVLAGSLQEVVPRPAPLAEPRQRVELDLAALTKAGYLVPGGGRSRLMDELRGIKRPLLSNAVGGRNREAVPRGNLILITSSLPGEGKSFLSLNLALSLAMHPDHRVLLVDADCTRRALTERLGLDQTRPGLVDLLADKGMDLADVELATNVDRLSVLPAGSTHDMVSELFGSQQMVDWLNRLAAQPVQRIVVFDAPPLLHAVEASVLAPQMGQVVLTVQAGRTPRGSVQHALGLLEECPVVLTVLNQARTPSPSSPYGYYAY